MSARTIYVYYCKGRVKRVGSWAGGRLEMEVKTGIEATLSAMGVRATRALEALWALMTHHLIFFSPFCAGI